MCGGWSFETESYLNDDGHKGDWVEEEEEGDLFYLPVYHGSLFLRFLIYNPSSTIHDHHHHFELIMDNLSPHSIKVSGRQFEGRKAICGFAIMIDLPKEVALVDIISIYS